METMKKIMLKLPAEWLKCSQRFSKRCFRPISFTCLRPFVDGTATFCVLCLSNANIVVWSTKYYGIFCDSIRFCAQWKLLQQQIYNRLSIPLLLLTKNVVGSERELISNRLKGCKIPCRNRFSSRKYSIFVCNGEKSTEHL